MNQIKRTLALLMVLVFISGFFQGLSMPVFGAVPNLNIKVDSYSHGNLKIRWESLYGSRMVEIEYHQPDADSKGVLNRQNVIQTTNTTTISGLQNDYIYDISIKVYNNVEGLGKPIGEGFIYFTPGISFWADSIDQGFTTIPGGGRETGNKPRMGLKWTIPKVYEKDTGNFIDAEKPEALTCMQNTLEDVYGDGMQISSLNFRINISTDASKLNAGSSQSSVLINYVDSKYQASMPGKDETIVEIERNTQGLHELMSLDLIGKSHPEDTTPPPEQYGLPDDDILPGTVYYINIKLVFKNNGGNQVKGVTVGDPSDQNGSNIMGEFSYTYTPIRFQITKDYANNAFVKVYKINHGSLNLPRLYYQVQASDDPTINGDWVVKKTMDDTYFSGDFALTVISGLNPYNEIYYKIVVKTDGLDDRLESFSMPYTLFEDMGRPPIPTGVVVEKTEQSLKVQEGEVLKSTDITISWDKPINWNEIKSNKTSEKDTVYHILLNTSQTELNIKPPPPLEGEGINYGNFPLKYRLVKYVSSKDVVEKGNRLEYTIKGFELFNGKYFTGFYTPEGQPEFSVEEIENLEGYPDFLIPNKVYYFQMYTTKGIHKGSTSVEHTSERSLTNSFTTLIETEREVPHVKNFKINTNSADIRTDMVTGEIQEISNYVKLDFEKPNIDWANYTPDNTGNNKDYYDLYASTRPIADSFILIGSTDSSRDTGNVIWTGQPQGTYVAAEIRKFSEGSEGYTAFGPELRPNTVYYFMIRTRLSIDNPPRELLSDSTTFLPVTTIKGPVEQPDYSGEKPLAPVDFSVDKDKSGNLLITGTSVTLRWSKLQKDVEYKLIYTSERVLPDAEEVEYQGDPLYKSITLNPLKDISPGYFEYIENSQEYRLTLEQGLFPNNIYYFSLKAIKQQDNKESSWASIPVTTLLIDPPTALKEVSDYQVSFFWEDRGEILSTENFTVYIQKLGEYKGTQIAKNRYTFTRSGNFYYGTIKNLEPNSLYNVKVYKNGSHSNLVCEKTGLSTRDEFHEIEVRWKGLKGYKYELAIRSDNQDEYITLKDSDLMEYSDDSFYYARIKRAGVKLPNGELRSLPLKANTKYYVKVRAVKVDSLNLESVAKSKYVGPVDTRTEYSQKDYDNEKNQEEYKDIFLEKLKNIENNFYWEALIGKDKEKAVLLKEDIVVNEIQNSQSLSYIIDIPSKNTNLEKEVIYIPLKVLEQLNVQNKLMEIRVSGAEYTFKPRTIELEGNNILVKVTITGKQGNIHSLPHNTRALSKMSNISIQTLVTHTTQKEINEMIRDRLYNKDTGIINPMLEGFSQVISGIGPESEKFIDEYMSLIVDLVGKELSLYVGSVLRTINFPNLNKDLTKFGSKAVVKLYHISNEEIAQPYASYSQGSSWIEIPDYINKPGFTSFEITRTGNFVVLNSSNKQSNSDGMLSVEKRWRDLGFNDIINFNSLPKDITRQELSGVLMKLFCEIFEIDIQKLRPGKNIYLKDDREIKDKYYKSVVISLEYGITKLNEDGKFYPESYINQQEFNEVLDRFLEVLEQR